MSRTQFPFSPGVAEETKHTREREHIGWGLGNGSRSGYVDDSVHPLRTGKLNDLRIGIRAEVDNRLPVSTAQIRDSRKDRVQTRNGNGIETVVCRGEGQPVVV